MGGDAPATQDTITAGPTGNEGDEDEEEGSGSEDGDELPSDKDAPVTTDTITNNNDNDDDGDEDNSGRENTGSQRQGEENSVASAANQCDPGKERGLFSGDCVNAPLVDHPSCFNQPEGTGIDILSPNTNKCVNAPLVDHPSAE
jgi:hypothetical protein